MIRKLLPVILVFAFMLIACSFNVNLPTTSITPGPTVTEDVNIPLPAGNAADLSLAFGAGTLKLHPGSTVLVSGTITYNIADFKPTITTNGSTVRIEQGNWKMTGIPTNFSNIKNDWDLSLGSTPLNLSIEAGAYKADYQFGGLALTKLTVKDGASQSVLDFNSPNASEMSLLRYETGASQVTLTGLGNANFESLEFNSGAGNYKLDFAGSLKRSGYRAYYRRASAARPWSFPPVSPPRSPWRVVFRMSPTIRVGPRTAASIPRAGPDRN